MKAIWVKHIKGNRGSAMVSTFLVIVVLLALGMGVLALSLANARQAVVTDVYERCYYVADGGARQAVEAVRNAALEQYRVIADAVKSANNADIGANTPSSFFQAISNNLVFSPQQPDSSAGGPSSVSVTITNNGGNPTRKYMVSATATDGNTSRSIVSSIDITFRKVALITAGFTPFGSETVLAGGLFDSSSVNVSINGTAKFGALKYKKWNFNYNGNSNPDQQTIDSLIYPTLADELNWDKSYPGFTNSVRTPSANLSLPPIANGTTVTNAAFKYPPYNWTVPSPIFLEGQSGASFTISNFRYIGGQIFSFGNLTITNDVIGTAANPVRIYCRGNLSLSNGEIRNVIIYCDGNVNTNGGGGFTDVTIYCNGTITDKCANRTNLKYYCGSYKMDGGNIYGDTVVYARNSIYLESTVRGLFYSNGTISIGSGSGLTGQLVAKGNVTLNGSFGFQPDAAMLARLYTDPFLTAGGSGTTAIVQPMDSEIFPGTPQFNEQ